MPSAEPDHWLTNLTNAQYGRVGPFHPGAGFTPGAGPWSAQDAPIEPERIPVLGFVVAKGAALVKVGRGGGRGTRSDRPMADACPDIPERSPLCGRPPTPSAAS